MKPPFASHLPQHQGFAKLVVSIDLYKKGPVVLDPGLPASATLSGQLLSPNVSFVGAGYYLEVGRLAATCVAIRVGGPRLNICMSRS